MRASSLDDLRHYVLILECILDLCIFNSLDPSCSVSSHDLLLSFSPHIPLIISRLNPSWRQSTWSWLCRLQELGRLWCQLIFYLPLLWGYELSSLASRADRILDQCLALRLLASKVLGNLITLTAALEVGLFVKLFSLLLKVIFLEFGKELGIIFIISREVKRWFIGEKVYLTSESLRGFYKTRAAELTARSVSLHIRLLHVVASNLSNLENATLQVSILPFLLGPLL